MYDPRNPKYDAVRRYIREPRDPKEAWPFVERYDPPRAGGRMAVDILASELGLFGRIRAYKMEFYVDLLNSGNLEAWAQLEGLASPRFIAPGVRYPASPTEEEVPPEDRGWLTIHDRKDS